MEAFIEAFGAGIGIGIGFLLCLFPTPIPKALIKGTIFGTDPAIVIAPKALIVSVCRRENHGEDNEHTRSASGRIIAYTYYVIDRQSRGFKEQRIELTGGKCCFVVHVKEEAETEI